MIWITKIQLRLQTCRALSFFELLFVPLLCKKKNRIGVHLMKNNVQEVLNLLKSFDLKPLVDRNETTNNEKSFKIS